MSPPFNELNVQVQQSPSSDPLNTKQKSCCIQGWKPILYRVIRSPDHPIACGVYVRHDILDYIYQVGVSSFLPFFFINLSPSPFIMSNNLVPLLVIKSAGSEFIPFPPGQNATVADFHSIRTKTTDSPSYLTSGFYKIEKGPAAPLHYTCEETKYVISGQIDVLDEATGVTHHLVPGDFAFFSVGTKVQFSTKSAGLAFYAVTRPIKAQHPNLIGREEEVKSKL